MRRLMLVRHARAVAARDSVIDFDRVLSAEGVAEAKEMAQRLASRAPRPDLVLSSPAARASHTAALFAQAWEHGPRIELQSRLYLATPDILLEVIHNLAETDVVIVGHNPGISELARRVALQPIGDLATAAVLQLEFDAPDWLLVGSEEPVHMLLESPPGGG
jgi:phosphohistidine phosphatase